MVETKYSVFKRIKFKILIVREKNMNLYYKNVCDILDTLRVMEKSVHKSGPKGESLISESTKKLKHLDLDSKGFEMVANRYCKQYITL
jgi:hypothetical protein